MISIAPTPSPDGQFDQSGILAVMALRTWRFYLIVSAGPEESPRKPEIHGNKQRACHHSRSSQYTWIECPITAWGLRSSNGR